MTQALWIPGPLPGVNELIAAAKSGHGRGNAYARIKAAWMEAIWIRAKVTRMKPMVGAVRLSFLWVERDRRRDPDNVAGGGRKLILDGLVKAGVLTDDGIDEIRSWVDTFAVDKTSPGVRVELGPA